MVEVKCVDFNKKSRVKLYVIYCFSKSFTVFIILVLSFNFNESFIFLPFKSVSITAYLVKIIFAYSLIAINFSLASLDFNSYSCLLLHIKYSKKIK